MKKILFAIFLVVLVALPAAFLEAEELLLKDVVVDDGMSIVSPPRTVAGLLSDENSIDDIASFYRTHSVYLDADSGLIVIMTYDPKDAVNFSFDDRKEKAEKEPLIDPAIVDGIVMDHAKRSSGNILWTTPAVLVRPHGEAGDEGDVKMAEELQSRREAETAQSRERSVIGGPQVASEKIRDGAK